MCNMFYFSVTTPGMVDIISDQRRNITAGGCVVHFAWVPPTNIGIDKLAYFIVYFNATHLNNEIITNTSLAMRAYPVCTCGAHNISITAVSHCLKSGQSRDHIVEDPEPLPNEICATTDTDNMRMNNGDCGNEGKCVL